MYTGGETFGRANVVADCARKLFILLILNANWAFSVRQYASCATSSTHPSLELREVIPWRLANVGATFPPSGPDADGQSCSRLRGRMRGWPSGRRRISRSNHSHGEYTCPGMANALGRRDLRVGRISGATRRNARWRYCAERPYPSLLRQQGISGDGNTRAAPCWRMIAAT